jgi:hypothetical protein
MRRSGKILVAMLITCCGMTGCDIAAEASPKNRKTAQDNAHALAMAAFSYAADHQDKLPASVSVIVVANSVNMDQLIDPRTGHMPMAQPPGGSDPKGIEGDVDAHTDFYYAGKDALTNVDPEVILFYDKGSFDSRVVSFADAHSTELKVGSPEMKKAVETHNAKHAKGKFAEVPADLAGPPKY